MIYRKLGQLTVSPIGMGCMGLSHAYGMPTEEKEAIQVIKHAADMGYTFFDTAECYVGTHPDGTISYNEALVGQALHPIRNQVVIATKCGVRHSDDGKLLMDSRPETIRRSVETSLKRLNTDYIDLYYQHRIDPDVPPEDVALTMRELIKEGKIRSWGISETTEEYLRRAHRVCPVTAIQNRYSMMARNSETLFPVLQELHVGLVAFSPLANGFLSGRYTPDSQFGGKEDYRSFMSQFTHEGFAKGKELLELLVDLAHQKHATPAQISLAWMLHKKTWIVPIPGSRQPDRLRENLAAAEIKLTAEEILAVDTALKHMHFLVFGGSSVK